jgi:hypothetical protein
LERRQAKGKRIRDLRITGIGAGDRWNWTTLGLGEHHHQPLPAAPVNAGAGSDRGWRCRWWKPLPGSTEPLPGIFSQSFAETGFSLGGDD